MSPDRKKMDDVEIMSGLLRHSVVAGLRERIILLRAKADMTK